MADRNAGRIRTRHGEVSLEEMADLLPGTGDVMAVVSRLYGNLWHAAIGGTWDLAAFYLRRVRGLFRGLAVTRPKYAEQLRDYQRTELEAVGQALVAREVAAFQAAYAISVERANALHVETGYPYLRWQTPAEPPDKGLDLGPTSPAG